LAEDILSNHLTPQQVQNPEYKVRKGKALTTKQRSTVNAILRKNLGDARVARFIFNHGVPTLLDLPIEREAPNRALLQNTLEELMTWHASLLQSILERQQHPDMTTARMLSDLDQKQWQRRRRERKLEAKQRMDQGALLVKQRDSGKRKFEDLSATEQQVLEDFETQKSKKQYAQECVKKLPHFQSKML